MLWLLLHHTHNACEGLLLVKFFSQVIIEVQQNFVLSYFDLFGVDLKMRLPDGCVGMMYVFESKKAARESMGNDTALQEVEVIKREG